MCPPVAGPSAAPRHRPKVAETDSRGAVQIFHALPVLSHPLPAHPTRPFWKPEAWNPREKLEVFRSDLGWVINAPSTCWNVLKHMVELCSPECRRFWRDGEEYQPPQTSFPLHCLF